jgi:hypothetical protein
MRNGVHLDMDGLTDPHAPDLVALKLAVTYNLPTGTTDINRVPG